MASINVRVTRIFDDSRLIGMNQQLNVFGKRIGTHGQPNSWLNSTPKVTESLNELD
jgi:hypothetical protein